MLNRILSRNLLAIAAVGLSLLTPAALAGTKAGSAESGLKVIQLPVRTDGPRSLDPVKGSTTYDNMACAQFYETLLVNSYADPSKLEPLLLSEMPTTPDNGLTWHFKLLPDVYFIDDPCFPGGKGRVVTTDDVFYSLKRLGDKAYQFKNWWLMKDTIKGLDAYCDTQNAADRFDYSGQVEGMKKISDTEFQIVLTKPVYRFLYILSMFQTSIVPHEGVEYWKDKFESHPVGTGPFILDTYVPKQSITANKNPNYHDVRYPARDEWSKDDRRARLHRAAGERVPFVDRIEFTMYPEDQPMWLEFEQGNLGYTQVPDDYFTQAFDKVSMTLKESYLRRGITQHSDRLLDFIFRGFNMEDPLLGGYDAKHKALRQAISLAIDLDEINNTFYNGRTIVYDGPIPPGLDGYPKDGHSDASYRGLDLERAKKKLAEAGYPNGQGLPPIRFYTSQSTINTEMAEMVKRQLAAINVQFDPVFMDFSTLIESINKKQGPMFGFAWASDYPDGENNLALFYSPNVSPGSNHFNYSRPEYDALYERIITMPPSAERTELYAKMRDMILEDCPYVGSQARQRFYLVNPWLLNCRPTERYYSWFKFLDVDDSKR